MEKAEYEIYLRVGTLGKIAWSIYGTIPEIFDRAVAEAEEQTLEPCKVLCYRLKLNAPSSRGEYLQEGIDRPKPMPYLDIKAETKKGQS